METFHKLFGSLLGFVYHCFDRIVIQGYFPLLTRPEHIVHFFRDVHHVYPITKDALAKRTQEYQQWVEAFARNHRIAIEWADDKTLKAKGLKREDYVRPYGAPSGRRPAQSRDHPPTARLLDPRPGTQILEEGPDRDQPAARLLAQPSRILPQFHLSPLVPDPSDLRTRVRIGRVSPDGRRRHANLWRPQTQAAPRQAPHHAGKARPRPSRPPHLLQEPRGAHLRKVRHVSP